MLQLIPADPKHQSLGDMRDNIISLNHSDSSYSHIKDEHHHGYDNPSIMSDISNITNHQSNNSFIHLLTPLSD